MLKPKLELNIVPTVRKLLARENGIGRVPLSVPYIITKNRSHVCPWVWPAFPAVMLFWRKHGFVRSDVFDLRNQLLFSILRMRCLRRDFYWWVPYNTPNRPPLADIHLTGGAMNWNSEGLVFLTAATDGWSFGKLPRVPVLQTLHLRYLDRNGQNEISHLPVEPFSTGSCRRLGAVSLFPPQLRPEFTALCYGHWQGATFPVLGTLCCGLDCCKPG